MSKPPTAAEKKRMAAIAEMGCIVCRKYFGVFTEAAVHHLVDGYRRGHMFTIPLCGHHHQGIPPGTFTAKQARKALGPRFHGEGVEFEQQFGTEEYLLELTNERLK